MQKGQGCQVQAHSRRVQDPQTGSLLPKDKETPQQMEIVQFIFILSNAKTASTMVSAWLYYITYLIIQSLFRDFILDHWVGFLLGSKSTDQKEFFKKLLV